MTAAINCTDDNASSNTSGSTWWLTWASVLYLSLPWAMFMAGWLRPLWAMALGAILLAGVVAVMVDGHRTAGAPWPRDRRGWWCLAVVLIATAGCMLISGAGGIGFQNLDYEKHNAVLKALIEHHWPVVFESSMLFKRPTALVYYVAYYLPGAAAGKIGGWGAAQATMFIWTAIGTALGLGWFARLAGRWPVVSVLFVLLMGGWDILGHLMGLGPTPNPIFNIPKFETWSGVWEYDCGVMSLAWVPQHTLIGWLAPALAIDGLERRRGIGRQLLLVGLASLWSPFAMVGLAPFVGVVLWRSRSGERAGRLEALAGLILLIVAGLYFATRQGRMPMGWMWRQMPPAMFAVRYPLFILIELGPLAGLWFLTRRSGRDDRGLWWACMAMLVLLPVYRLGRYNDLAMRGSDPAMFAVMLLTLRAVIGETIGRRRRAAAIAFAVVFIVGMLAPLHNVSETAGKWRRTAPPMRDLPAIEYYHSPEISAQYTGPTDDSPFFKHLARSQGN